MHKFCLEDKVFLEIKKLFTNYPSLITQDFEIRIKQSIRVLHFHYLWGACREAEKTLSQYNKHNLFDFIMDLYSKRRRIHQASFLLLHCFENALRSSMAVSVANAFNIDKDDWFLKNSGNKNQIKLICKVKKIIEVKNRSIHQSFNQKLKLNRLDTFKIFDLFSMGDLEKILQEHYGIFEHLFINNKTYKNQVLPVYRTKSYLIEKIKRIRNARNEIFHNKPSKIKFKKDLEALLLHLGYNLADAINMGNLQDIIKLQYKYDKNR